MSRLDHDANVRPWLQVAARVGATVRWAEFDRETGVLAVDQYRDLVNERTRLVALTAASNAIGSRTNVAEVAEIAHASGALVYVDGVHATPARAGRRGRSWAPTSTSRARTSGPARTSPPVSRRWRQWERMRPEKLVPAPDEGPDRFEHGTISFELLAGVVGAVGHLAALGPAGGSSRRTRVLESMRAAQVYESEIFTRVVTGLAELPGVTQCPAPPFRCPTVSFRVADQHPAETAERLGAEGVCVYSGDNYAYEYFRGDGAARQRGSGARERVPLQHRRGRGPPPRRPEAGVAYLTMAPVNRNGASSVDLLQCEEGPRRSGRTDEQGHTRGRGCRGGARSGRLQPGSRVRHRHPVGARPGDDVARRGQPRRGQRATAASDARAHRVGPGVPGQLQLGRPVQAGGGRASADRADRAAAGAAPAVPRGDLRGRPPGGQPQVPADLVLLPRAVPLLQPPVRA